MHSPRRHTERRAKVTLLDLIRRNHLDHDARVAVVRAIRGAEVAVFGASAASLTEQLAAILRPCGAYVVDAIGASTRFAVATPEATMREIDEVRLIGLPMLTPRDIHEMAKTFTSVTQLADVRSAARRAREDSARRLPKAQRPVIGPLLQPARTSGMATKGTPRRPEVIARRESDASDSQMHLRRRVSEEEANIEEHVRTVRASDRSSAFQYHRRPL